jgi:hypothetical protein
MYAANKSSKKTFFFLVIFLPLLYAHTHKKKKLAVGAHKRFFQSISSFFSASLLNKPIIFTDSLMSTLAPFCVICTVLFRLYRKASGRSSMFGLQVDFEYLYYSRPHTHRALHSLARVELRCALLIIRCGEITPCSRTRILCSSFCILWSFVLQLLNCACTRAASKAFFDHFDFTHLSSSKTSRAQKLYEFILSISSSSKKITTSREQTLEGFYAFCIWWILYCE